MEGALQVVGDSLDLVDAVLQPGGGVGLVPLGLVGGLWWRGKDRTDVTFLCIVNDADIFLSCFSIV